MFRVRRGEEGPADGTEKEFLLMQMENQELSQKPNKVFQEGGYD